MGNEASLEGGAGDGPLPPGGTGPGPGPGAGKPPSAPAAGGQLPAAGAARATAGPPGPGPGPGPGSVSRRLDPKEPPGSQRAASPTPKQASATAPGRESPRETRAQGPAGQEADGPRRTLQVDSRTQRSGRSPSVSPDRGSTPTSPYSVPQIAPLPSSTLCPICKTSDLTSTPSQPNFNTCTQCHNKVCNQCGFNPNPHLTQVKEWLCLNCQMQRALGMDMTTAPRSKSQQQLHSPALSPAQSPAKQPLGKPEPERSQGPGAPQPGPRQAETARATTVPGPAQAAAPPEMGRASPQPLLPVKPSTAEPRPPAGEALAKSATTVPSGPGAAEQTQEGLTGKLFGLGASLLTQASTLMSVQPEAEPQGQAAPSKGPPKIVFSDASKEAGPRPPGSGPGPGPAPGAKTEPGARTGPGLGPGAPARTGGTTSPKHGRAEHQAATKATAKPKTMPKERATCPLCQAELNVDGKGPANYNTCTSCKLQVCNLCGFNPTPHLVEKTEWLCLNCQTKRLLEGSLGEPTPLPLPTSQQPPAGAPLRAPGAAPLKQKGPQGPGQPSGPPPAKASPLPTKPSPQAKPLRASEPSRTLSGAQEKKTGVPAKAEPGPKPPPETTLPPGTPKGKTGPRRTEPATPVVRAVPEAPKGGESEELVGKPSSQDPSRSPQSLSDTGYSSDGISSSQSEITGIVRHEVEQLDSAGVTGPRPPSPSELHKVGSSMRPSLEAQGPAPRGEPSKPPRSRRDEQKRRPHSLSIMPEAYDSDEELEDILEEEEDSLEWGHQREQQDAAESSDDFGSQLRHDYVEDSSEGGLSPLPPQPPARAAELTDEEFMRRQILEMSAEEDNLEEEDTAASGHGLAKPSAQKGGPRPRPEPSQDPAAPPKRRLPHNATTGYEELLPEGGPAEADDSTGALQGGLRRFKTIELNSAGSYGHELDLGQGPDPSLEREPELEMESLTGSPEDRSRGEHSSTLPASTPSYTSGTSPTSLSSLEEDSDSSPSRRQRLEEAKQQRKARHRSHGPLLPTIEDSSEEEELREEEELLREQEKMREVEQQRIRSTARKTRRDKEELRAQRRRERSKTPPSNLSPIEDASPTEELRQAAEMEELHRSSCSEYSPSPSLDSEAEALDGGPSRLYKSGSEYNLPTFMSLYSPTETPSGGAATPGAGRPLKSAEEAYEEMMRKAELLQRQQGQVAGGPSQPTGPQSQGAFEYQDTPDQDYGRAAQPAPEGTPASLGAAVYEEILQTSQSIARMRQASSRDLAFAEDKKKEKQFLNADSAYMDPMKQNGGPLTPGTSPTQLAAPVSFSTSTSSDSSGGRVIPDVRVTQHFAKEPQDPLKLHSSPASPSSASKEVGVSFSQGPGAPASTAVAPCPASLSRGYMTPTSPAGSERSPSPSSVGRSYGQSPATANYGSQTEELPAALGGPTAGGRVARDKPLSVSDGESGPHKASRGYAYFTGSSPPLSPSSPSESPTFSPGKLGPRATAEFSTQTPSPTPALDMPRSPGALTPAPMVAQGTQTPHRPSTPRLVWQQSSREAPFMVITLASDASGQTRMVHASASTSPVCSPTTHSYSQTTPPSASQLPPEPPGPPGFPRAPSAGADGPLAVYGWGALPAENISLCRISSVPGTSRVEPGPRPPGSAVVDLRTAVKPTPIILTDQGMDLTSLAVEARKYGLALDPIPGRQSTAVQPLVINLNAQEQTHAFLSTSTTVSITMASSVLMAQQKQPVVYGDPFQSRLDFGQGAGSPVCLAQVKQVEQAVQTAPYRGGPRGRPREPKFARYNLPNQVAPLARRDVLITQMGTAQSVGLKSGPVPEPGAEPHRAAPPELRSHAMPSARKPHTVVVQMGEGTAGTVTTLLPEEPAGALDLTGMRPESQMACCDMVYKFPFGSSCTGTFHPTPSAPEKSVADIAPPGQSGGPFYSPRDPEPPEPPTYRAQGVAGPGPHEEQRPYPQGLHGRLYSSMSDTNLAEAGLNYHAHRIGQLFQGPGRDSAVDLSSLKHSYSLGFVDGRYLGQGLQYGSYTDLRHPTDVLTHPLPMRRYSSVSNIYSDHRYGPRGDAAGFQEASLAQYSATTAREISRMCAALNSMDQYGGRHGSGGGGPDLMQYQPQPGPGLSAPQGLAPLRPGLLGNPTFPEGHPGPGNLAQYRPPVGQGTAIRQLLPSTATVRAADGMIYSTINTPIAATLPITTQPASVLRPMVRRGMYRPYVSGGVTAVPLTSLTRMPVIAPRIPLGPTGLYRYPAPSRFPTASSVPPAEGPVYLGKPAAAKAPGAGGPPRPELPAGAVREEPLSTATPAAAKEALAAPAPAPAPLAGQKPPVDAAPGGGSGALGRPGLEKEDAAQEERQRKQQEQLLQLERERVELEKLRQLRLQEELERERVELQRHREEEQLLVQRELQELQTIKHHVLQQQQEERQAQFALQREQLAQQRLQLEQIQQLQQQLQQQLEEQKQRQKAPFPVACEAPGRGPPPPAPELAQNGQYWPPLSHTAFIAVAGPEGPGQPREPGLHRGLPSSASDMSLQTEEPWEAGRSGIKKRHSMPRLRDACEPESGPEPCAVRRIADSSVQTDDEEGEGRYLLSRRRRARRSADCSVQTDDEDSAEWEQPVRRRRSRLSRHSDSGSDSKHDAAASSAPAAAAAKATSSVGIQTITDCSVQTEPDQLPRVSPAIHITAATDPKVEIVRYISAPEKTGRGESLACQTEPEGQAQGVAGPQLVGPTAISPYLPGIQIVTPGPLGRFEKKKPDPLEIGYQAQLPPESLSQLVSRQPPKSPQVLYSPVSPLSPHRLLDTSFASSERLNKAHVSPQKHFTADSALRQQTLPRPMKTLQRSLSDPKPLSPTAEESAKERFSLYQHQGGLGSQVSALPPNGLVRKVKRTLPSPPPEEAHLPLAGQAPPQLYAASLLQHGLAGPTAVPATKASLLRDLDRDLRLVEHESTKLRKKQAELDEEEKEIDAKLKYLELGITQRKESLAKDRGGRDYPPLRGLGEHRDYLSDSELNQLRLQGCATPAGQYADFPVTAAAPATPSGPTAFQQPRFPPPAPQYTAGSGGPTQNGFPAHQAPTYPGPSTYPAPAFPPGTSYPAEPGLPGQQAFRPTGHYAAQTPMPTTQSTLFPVPADSRAPHQKPRQTSLADLEQKVPTNYEVIASPVVAMSSGASESSYSGPAASGSYEQGKAAEPPRASDRSSVSLSSASTYPSDSHYTSLEQNVPRNYVMIDDISELTKDSTSTAPESQRLETLGPSSSGRPGKEPGEPGILEGSVLPCCYTRGEEESEEDSYDPRGKSGHHRSVESNGRPTSAHYYGDSDYRHGARAEKYGPGPMGPKHPSKSLAPAAISSKRSKHRKQGMEQKISKFSPIEEAKDVESDLASYPSPAVSSSLASRGRKFQDEITYGLKKNVYEQQRYYGVSSRDPVEEDDRMYGGSGRSRVASAYSGEKLSSHDFGGRGKGYEREREAVERLQKAGPKLSSLSMAHGRARPPMRSQTSEEESPVSPLGRPRPAGGPLPPGDTCPQFCSSHSMPDVQEHVKDGPRAHTYKREEGYILDDSHCVVSDSEAYHLGQEETDWFDKPRDARSDRFRHHGGHAVSSSSQKRGPARHSYHDYDEPPEEGLWPHDEGGPSRHASAKEHRHHGDHGRHSGRHAGEEPGRRAAKPHARDLGRHEARPHPQPSPAPAMQKKGQPGYPSSAEYSQPARAPSAYHHASDSKKGSRQAHTGPATPQPKPEPQPQPQGRQAAPGPQQSQPPPSRQTPSATVSRQPPTQQQQQGLGAQPPQQAPAQARLQQQGQPAARGPAPAASQPAGKAQPGPTTASGPQAAGPPRAEQANGSKGTAKAPPQGRAPQAQPPPGPGPAGMKAGARPGGTPGASAGQPGADGESVLSKILPGGAAEQAGKLTEAVSAFGKKFSSFW
ncbi:protein bassoon [Phoca vitulina]|uniref:protein bassoon n=1 Tax=Phoca vitulina TaxID=9720 RepID=UPI001395E298|nr:protein bassoon [Phoca vitulina]